MSGDELLENLDEWTKNRCKVRLGKFTKAKFKYDQSGNFQLDLPELEVEKLPTVSVVTITRNRAKYIGVMLYNWCHFIYPREKLEWIIVDDSDIPDQDLTDFLPEDPNIKYYKLDKWMRISDKRNYAVEKANNEYIVHMDDDDFYFHDSILAKVKVMMHYRCDGVLSAIPIGIYDMMTDTSTVIDHGGNTQKSSNSQIESSFAYKKSYWEKNKFYSIYKKGNSESAGFIHKNFNRFVNMHFMFNQISITHSSNFTGNTRRMEFDSSEFNKESVGDFKKIFPEDFVVVLENLKKMLLN